MPAVAIISLGFVKQAKYQAEMLGLGDAVALFVKHPISNATAAELGGKAQAVFPQVIQGLTSEGDLPRYPAEPSCEAVGGAGADASAAQECSS